MDKRSSNEIKNHIPLKSSLDSLRREHSLTNTPLEATNNPEEYASRKKAFEEIGWNIPYETRPVKRARLMRLDELIKAAKKITAQNWDILTPEQQKAYQQLFDHAQQAHERAKELDPGYTFEKECKATISKIISLNDKTDFRYRYITIQFHESEEVDREDEHASKLAYEEIGWGIPYETRPVEKARFMRLDEHRKEAKETAKQNWDILTPEQREECEQLFSDAQEKHKKAVESTSSESDRYKLEKKI